MVITNARAAIIVHTDSAGYKIGVDELDTPQAVGNINTDDYKRYGIYTWSPTESAVVRVSGGIALHPLYPGEMNVGGGFIDVMVSLGDTADGDVLFALLAPASTSTAGSGFNYDDFNMASPPAESADRRRLSLSVAYVAPVVPSFFLGTGRGRGEPPPIFWKDLVKAREIP